MALCSEKEMNIKALLKLLGDSARTPHRCRNRTVWLQAVSPAGPHTRNFPPITKRSESWSISRFFFAAWSTSQHSGGWKIAICWVSWDPSQMGLIGLSSILQCKADRRDAQPWPSSDTWKLEQMIGSVAIDNFILMCKDMIPIDQQLLTYIA